MQALETGISMVEELKNKGYSLIATGEMGIGNTTTSSAVASVLLNEDGRKNDRPGSRPFLRGNDTEDQRYQKSH